jgi:hypothetical protein
VARYKKTTSAPRPHRQDIRRAQETGVRNNEMHVCEMHAHGIHAHEMYAREVHAYEVHACDVHAYDMHAHDMHARNVHAHETSAHDMHARKMHTRKIHAREILSARIGIVQPFALLGTLPYTLACTAKSEPSFPRSEQATFHLQATVYTRQPGTYEGGGDDDGILWNTEGGKVVRSAYVYKYQLATLVE